MATAQAGGLRRGAGPRRRWPRRVLAGVALALVAAALLGVVVAPPVIRRVTETRLGAWLGRRVSVARVRVDPLALVLTIEGVRVYERDGRTPFVGFSRLRVDVEARSLWRRGLVVRELRLEAPRARVVRERADPTDPLAGYNFSDIVARLRGPPGGEGEAPREREAPPRFSLSNIQIVDGAVAFDDRPTATRHDVSDLSLGVPFVSTLPADADVFVDPRLSLRVDGTPFVVAARTRPFAGARDTTAHVRVSALDLVRWLPLVPLRLPVVVASAALDADLDVAFAPRPDAAPTLTLRGRVALDRFAVESAAGAPLGRVGEIEVVVKEIDVAARRVAIERIRVTGLDALVRRLRDGSLDWERVFAGYGPRARPRGAGRAAGGRAPLVEVGALDVTDAKVRLRDETMRPAFTTVVAPLDLSGRNLSNALSARGEVTLRLRATPGGTVKQEGTLSLAPLAASGTVTVDVPKVSAFAPYLHELVAVDARSGRVRVAGRYRLEVLRGDPRLAFSRVALDVQDLVLGPRGGAPTLRVPSLSMRDTTVDLAARSISIGPIHGRGGWISVLRAADGKLRLAALLPPRERPPGPPHPSGPPWRLVFTLIDLQGWNGRFEDRKVHPPVDVAPSSVSLRARDFEVTPELHGHADLDLDVGERGHVAVKGTAAIRPIELACEATVRTAPIAPFQGYFVKYIGARIAGGTVSAEGWLKLSFAPAPWKPKGREVHLDISGDAELANVVARDGRKGRELLRWQSLRIGGVELTLHPVRLSIRDVALVEPAARLELEPGRRSNLGPFGNPDRKPKVAGQKRAANQPVRRPSISIGRFTMRGGRVRFLDRSIRPPFFAVADALDADITSLSSQRTERAEVRLRGRVEHAGELAVSGTLNPLAGVLALDMKLRLRNLDLPFANPYAARYVGYLVDKGKLDLTVESHAERGKLEAQSRIVIEKLQLGPQVKSPRALKIPVELAVSALRDRSGRFELDVPVSGSIGSPSFRLAPAIEGAFTSVLRRVVTLPFALVGRVGRVFRGGGGETLSIVAFAPGAPGLDQAARQKVAALARTLRERREGSFAIEGAADPARDVEAVRRFLREHGRTVDGATEGAALEALARWRAEQVRDALARAAPSTGSRVFIVRPKVAAGAGSDVRVRVQKD
jgi:uncharacterized protein involved in outer membrane biogenesis